MKRGRGGANIFEFVNRDVQDDPLLLTEEGDGFMLPRPGDAIWIEGVKYRVGECVFKFEVTNGNKVRQRITVNLTQL